MIRRKIIIIGAAGRDFFNFNILFRNNKEYEVICFTADQIPGISERSYPKELSGKLYPKGIPIHPEDELPELIKKNKVTEVILAYSDLSNQDVMNKASLVNACGADFRLLSTYDTMLKSRKKVISVCAVRTGCGKSQTTRKIALLLKNAGKRVVVVRHPMPYGDLNKQNVQRFETLDDLKKHNCTIEEREEYEQHILNGIVVFAGVDYTEILKDAEKEADVIIWDGGNNDTSFFSPDLNIVIADALRPGHEMSHYPGQTSIRMADVVIINKENSAPSSNIIIIEKNLKKLNPKAIVVHADSILSIKNPEKAKELEGKKAVIVEDGPTLTHGGMSFGAGFKKAKELGVVILDAKKYAVGSIQKVYEKYSHLGEILPAMGYSSKQIKELEETIKKAKPEIVISGTPIDLNLVLNLDIPIIDVKYSLQEKNIKLEMILKEKKFI